MKRILLSLSLLFAITLTSWSQVDVYFRINHKLGAASFDPSHVASNNLGNNFTVERLDYYISEITLIHDGGQQTPVTGHYILVKAKEQTNDYLGSFNITNLEGVQFGIGVDPSVNHADITTFPPNHPLSFQSPSMHWGWAAGYRFIAIEGKSGSGMNQSWQLHALGDANYGYTTVNTSGTLDGNNLVVALDADYEQGMNNITINGSLNYHGENGQAVTIMNNFKTLVFTEGTAGIGLEEKLLNIMSITPNPSSGKVTLELSNEINHNSVVSLRDLSGRLISEQSFDSYARMELDLNHQGIYLVSLYENGILIGTSKLIIQ